MLVSDHVFNFEIGASDYLLVDLLTSTHEGASLYSSKVRVAVHSRVKATCLHVCLWQVTVGCGTVCVFHVGGFKTSLEQDAVPRWEFFIGDSPHSEGLGPNNRRQPFDQISQSESLAMPGDVIVSREVAEVGVLGQCPERVLSSCLHSTFYQAAH